MLLRWGKYGKGCLGEDQNLQNQKGCFVHIDTSLNPGADYFFSLTMLEVAFFAGVS